MSGRGLLEQGTRAGKIPGWLEQNCGLLSTSLALAKTFGLAMDRQPERPPPDLVVVRVAYETLSPLLTPWCLRSVPLASDKNICHLQMPMACMIGLIPTLAEPVAGFRETPLTW